MAGDDYITNYATDTTAGWSNNYVECSFSMEEVINFIERFELLQLIKLLKQITFRKQFNYKKIFVKRIEIHVRSNC